MKLTNKIMCDGLHIGFRVSEGEHGDELVYPISIGCLYSHAILQPLTASGYKVYGMGCDIEDPVGQPIMSLPVELMDNTHEDYDMLVSVFPEELSEPEVAQYMTQRSAASYTAMKKSEPLECLINTREELVQYLARYNSRNFASVTNAETRPLNSFVNPDALFSVKELDKTGESLPSLIEGSLHLDSYDTYSKVLEPLIANSGRDTLSDDVNLNIWDYALQWGFPGLKDDIVEYRYEVGPAPVNMGQFSVWGFVDAKGNLYYKNHVVSVNNPITHKFNEGDIIKPLVPSSYVDIFTKRNSPFAEHAYVPIRLEYAGIKGHIAMKLLCKENGVVYKAYVDPRGLTILNSLNEVIVYINGYRVDTTAGSVPVYYFENSRDFCDHIVCEQYARSLIDQYKVKPKHSSTYAMLRDMGVNPFTAIKYLGKFAHTIGFENKNVSYGMGADLMAHGVRKSYIEKYFDRFDIDLSMYDEYVPYDVAWDIISAYINDLSDDQLRDLNGIDATGKPVLRDLYETRFTPHATLEFVAAAMGETTALSHQGEGKTIDGTASVLDLAFVVHNACFFNTQGQPHFTIREALRCDSGVNLSFFVGSKKDAEFFGAAMDYYEFLSAKAIADFILIPRGTFAEFTGEGKEISNRDFAGLFTCICKVNAEGKRTKVAEMQDALYKLIRETVDKEFPEDRYFGETRIHKIFTAAAQHLAMCAMLELMGLAKRTSDKPDEIVIEVNDVTPGGSVKRTVQLPAYLLNWAATCVASKNLVRPVVVPLYNLTVHEFEHIRGTGYFFNYCLVDCVNNIWNLSASRPLPRYNLALNFVNQELFNNWSDNWKASYPAGKICEISKYEVGYMITEPFDYYPTVDYNVWKVDMSNADAFVNTVFTSNFCNEYQDEFTTQYWQRFNVLRKPENCPAGKFLNRIPLKADLLMAGFAGEVGVSNDSILTSNEYLDKPDSYNANVVLMPIGPVTESPKLKLFSSEKGFKPINFEVEQWLRVFNGVGVFNTPAIDKNGEYFIVAGDNIYCYKNYKLVDVYDYNTFAEKLETQFANSNCIAQVEANSWYIRTIRGLFVLEV